MLSRLGHAMRGSRCEVGVKQDQVSPANKTAYLRPLPSKRQGHPGKLHPQIYMAGTPVRRTEAQHSDQKYEVQGLGFWVLEVSISKAKGFVYNLGRLYQLSSNHPGLVAELASAAFLPSVKLVPASRISLHTAPLFLGSAHSLGAWCLCVS